MLGGQRRAVAEERCCGVDLNPCAYGSHDTLSIDDYYQKHRFLIGGDLPAAIAQLSGFCCATVDGEIYTLNFRLSRRCPFRDHDAARSRRLAAVSTVSGI